MQKNLSSTLIEIAGTDKSFCLAAWQSTFKELGIEIPVHIEDRVDAIFDHLVKTKKKTPQELLSMLAGDKHHTPFEFSYFRFDVCADIATHIHCLKHRVGVSINTESARYKELEDKHYIPSDWTDSPELEGLAMSLRLHTKTSERLYHEAIKRLVSAGMKRKRAKETARYFLGYNKMLNFTIAFNMRSFLHFQQLRNSPHAQVEVRTIAQMMLEEVKKTNRFNLTLKAFGYA